MPALRLRITGRVQGVFFRAEAEEQARALGVTGWIRNAADGSVEAHAEGPPEAVEAFVEWCKRGPSGAAVEMVESEPATEEGYTGFEMRRD